MSRPLVVVTSSGVVTCLAWWGICRIDGKSVVLSSSGEDDGHQDDLIVGELRSEAEAGAFYRTLTQRARLKARIFSAAEWPGTMRDQDADESSGGAHE